MAEAHQQLLKFNIDSAEILLHTSETQDTQNYVNYLIANYIDFLKLATTEDFELYKQIFNRQNIRINAVKKSNDRSAFKNYVLGEMYFQMAFLEVKFGHLFSGLFDFVRAYSYLNQNNNTFPTFHYHKKTLGMMQIMLSLVPLEFKWVIKTLGYEVDINEGIKLVNQSIQANTPISDEAQIMLLWVNVLILQSEDKYNKIHEEQLQKLCSKYEVVKLLEAYIHKKNNQIYKAVQILENISPSSKLHQTPYLYFFKAHVYLYHGNYTLCAQNMQAFLQKYKGITLKKSAFYHLYLADYLSANSNNQNLKRYRDSVLMIGKTFSEFDKIAYKSMQNEQKPTRGIIKSRLYYDGGYYNESLNTLYSIDPQTLDNNRELTEYYYRHARIYQSMKDTTNALKYFRISIKKQGKNDYYFSPFSYLQMALLNKDSNPKLALAYIDTLTVYTGYEYENSINAEAIVLKNTLKRPPK